MATFDQLPAEQRAIIELVVARGRSYDTLADVLQVSSQRVRELARDALVELSPVSAKRVDPQWRGQVADYLLGQQSGAEATATRSHLKRSEASRIWALSLLDALDTLFGADGELPEIPEGEAAAAEPAPPAVVEEEPEEEEERPRERTRERERLGRERAAAPERGDGEDEKKERDRERERAAEKERDRDREREKDRERARDRDDEDRDEDRDGGKRVAAAGGLSPAARSALRRRRLYGGLAAIVVLALVVVGILALTGAFSSDDNDGASASTSSTPTPTSTTPGSTTQEQPKVLGQIALSPINGAKAQGVAYILQQGSQQVLAVTAKLPPLPQNQRKAAYNVWLYNSPQDASSIGAQFTTPQGDYQGVGKLPANYKRFKFIDVSRQAFNNKTGHSGDSVLRGSFSSLKPVPQGQQPGAGGTQTTP
jgi:Sigma-70, region 4